MSEAQYAVLGAGAMGSILAAHLARAGHSVIVLARGKRAAQVKRDGLRIRGLSDIDIAVPVLTEPRELRRADFLIVATKAIATATALEPLRGAAIGCALSIQNGVMKNELLADAFGRDRVLGTLANTSGELLSTDEVLFTRNVNLLIGEPEGGISTRAESLARTLDAAGVRSTAVPDITVQDWSKFVAWVPFAVLSVTTRANTWRFMSDPDAAIVFVHLIREMGQLATALGIELTDESLIPVATLCRCPELEAVEIVLRTGAGFRKNAPLHRLSSLQDLLAGRPLEVEETLGHAVRMGKARGLSLPLLENAWRLLLAIDRAREA